MPRDERMRQDSSDRARWKPSLAWTSEAERRRGPAPPPRRRALGVAEIFYGLERRARGSWQKQESIKNHPLGAPRGAPAAETRTRSRTPRLVRAGPCAPWSTRRSHPRSAESRRRRAADRGCPRGRRRRPRDDERLHRRPRHKASAFRLPLARVRVPRAPVAARHLGHGSPEMGNRRFIKSLRKSVRPDTAVRRPFRVARWSANRKRGMSASPR